MTFSDYALCFTMIYLLVVYIYKLFRYRFIAYRTNKRKQAIKQAKKQAQRDVMAEKVYSAIDYASDPNEATKELIAQATIRQLNNKIGRYI